MNKKWCTISVAAVLITNAQSAVLVNFTNQGGVYDGKTTVDVALNDVASSVNFIMTVTAVGGNLNSNSTGLGVVDANLQTAESITISFNVQTQLISLDLGGISDSLSDGATIQVGANAPVNLYTDQLHFNGTTDVWSPPTPIILNAGESILIFGSDPAAVIDIDGLNIAAVPEPSATMLLGIGGLALLSRRKRSVTKK